VWTVCCSFFCYYERLDNLWDVNSVQSSDVESESAEHSCLILSVCDYI